MFSRCWSLVACLEARFKSCCVSLEAICWKPPPLPCSPQGQSSFTTGARSQYWTLPFGTYLTPLKHIGNGRFSAPKLVPSYKVILLVLQYLYISVWVPSVMSLGLNVLQELLLPCTSSLNIIAPKLKTRPAFQNGVSVHWAPGISVAETTKAMMDLWYTTSSGVSHCCRQQATISSEH